MDKGTQTTNITRSASGSSPPATQFLPHPMPTPNRTTFNNQIKLTLKQQLAMFCLPRMAQLGPTLMKTYQRRVAQRAAMSAQDVGVLAEAWTAHLANTQGIRVIEVSLEEAELYANTDLGGVNVQEWKQSYPLIFVAVQNALVAVVNMTELTVGPEKKPVFPIQLLAHPSNAIVDHAYIAHQIESTLKLADGEDTPELGKPSINTSVGRIALNAVLHLSNYPELYGRHPSAAYKLIVRRANDRGEMKRHELLPQFIRLRPPLDNESRHVDTDILSSGSHRRPHWRRGHWRQAAVGQGRTKRRHVWIKPILINGLAVIGPTASSTIFADAKQKPHPLAAG